MDSDFSRGCTKNANSTFWDSAALTGERRQMAISYTLSLYIHLSCIWGMQINQTEGRGDTHADDCSRASSCMIIFIPAHHVIEKALLNTNRGPLNCRLSINMSEFFGRFLCVLCDSLWTDPRSGAPQLFFFFPLCCPITKRAPGSLFPTAMSTTKKAKREKKKARSAYYWPPGATASDLTDATRHDINNKHQV